MKYWVLSLVQVMEISIINIYKRFSAVKAHSKEFLGGNKYITNDIFIRILNYIYCIIILLIYI